MCTAPPPHEFDRITEEHKQRPQGWSVSTLTASLRQKLGRRVTRAEVREYLDARK